MSGSLDLSDYRFTNIGGESYLHCVWCDAPVTVINSDDLLSGVVEQADIHNDECPADKDAEDES